MIKKLRRKFIITLVGIVFLFLTAIFLFLYYSAKANFQRQNMGTLLMVVKEDFNRRPRNDDGLELHGRRRPNPPSGFLVAEESPEGELSVKANLIYGIDDSSAGQLVAMVCSLDSDSGVIENMNLMYLKDQRRDGSVRYAFLDIKGQRAALYWQIVHSAAVGSVSLIAFSLLAIFLSRWVTRPVEQAWKQQQQFAADASHELKTPLTVILSNISLMVQSGEIRDGNNRKRMDHIQSEALRMKELVENLLFLTKNDSALPSARIHTALDFSYAVNRAAAVFEPVAFEMGKAILSQVEEPVFIIGDEKKLHQLVTILLDNACKYSRENSSIQVELSTKGKEAVLVVSNYGLPFTKEELNLIFNRFYRADPSRGNIPGYGLGLSIARNIVSEHNGRIEAGTDGVEKNWFTVRLPAVGR